MAPYHFVLVHFPLALWTTAALVILFRALSDSPFAKACDRVLVPLLALGVLSTVPAYIVGLLIWPWESLSASPLARNHFLAATWSLAYWILLLITRWKQGESIWQGHTRWIMPGLAVLGSFLLTVTGTLGGHLAGAPSAVSKVLHFMGWEVYTTFYVPDFTLWLLVAGSIFLFAIGLWGRRNHA